MYFRLIKYKLSLAVTLTAVVGYLIKDQPIPFSMILLALGTFLVAGGAGGLNQYQERKYDILMERTRSRPLPSGTIKPSVALGITMVMIIAGLLILLNLSWKTALLGLLNVFLYNFLYTRMKRTTYLAILPGALVGAVPPVMGWTAAGGNINDMTIIYISLLIFLWQIPHFWMLLIRYRHDYELAGFPTILKKLDEIQVRRIVFVWISMLSLFSLSPFLFGIVLNKTVWIILAIADFSFIIIFFFLLLGKRGNPGKAFILSNIFISLLYILFAAGSLMA